MFYDEVGAVAVVSSSCYRLCGAIGDDVGDVAVVSSSCYRLCAIGDDVGDMPRSCLWMI